jgi:cytochrome c553
VIRLRTALTTVLSVLALSPITLSRQAQPKAGNAQQQTQDAKSNVSEGEKRFRTNCGRCHNPPEEISPREARAVLRQMRVRAMLSAEDERLILKYLAP